MKDTTKSLIVGASIVTGIVAGACGAVYYFLNRKQYYCFKQGPVYKCFLTQRGNTVVGAGQSEETAKKMADKRMERRLNGCELEEE